LAALLTNEFIATVTSTSSGSIRFGSPLGIAS
jgi:hypothetical protein